LHTTTAVETSTPAALGEMAWKSSTYFIALSSLRKNVKELREAVFPGASKNQTLDALEDQLKALEDAIKVNVALMEEERAHWANIEQAHQYEHSRAEQDHARALGYAERALSRVLDRANQDHLEELECVKQAHLEELDRVKQAHLEELERVKQAHREELNRKDSRLLRPFGRKHRG
jgi:hypothetical protein